MKLIKTAGYEKKAQFGAVEGGLPSESPQMGHSDLAEAMDGLVGIVNFALRSSPDALKEALKSMDVKTLRGNLHHLSQIMEDFLPSSGKQLDPAFVNNWAKGKPEDIDKEMDDLEGLGGM